jgi:hypothetical protein
MTRKLDADAAKRAAGKERRESKSEAGELLRIYERGGRRAEKLTRATVKRVRAK